MDPLVIKGIILALAMLAGILCLFLGYKLYDKGVIEKGQASVSGAGTTVTLKDYGPGVVFALFGALIIIFCITRPFNVDTKTTIYSTPRDAMPSAAKNAQGLSPQPGNAVPLTGRSQTTAPAAGQTDQAIQQHAAPVDQPDHTAPQLVPGILTTTETNRQADVPRDRLSCKDGTSDCPA